MTRAKAAECRTKLERHRVALEAGADPVTVTRWIAETNAELAGAEADIRAARTSPERPVLTEEEIEELVTALGSLTDLLGDAEAADRYEVYSRLALRLTYDPGKQEIRVEANLDPDRLTADHDHYHGVTVGVRGAYQPESPRTVPLSGVLSFA